MTFDQLLALLDTAKGTGKWREAAQVAGLHYNTVARIARGAMPRPSEDVAGRLKAAVAQVIGKPRA
jgi:hypothetical protein